MPQIKKPLNPVEKPGVVKRPDTSKRPSLWDRLSRDAKGKKKIHNYVEMGDGLKWATCNIGASNPEDFGDYIAWGESEPKYSSLSPLEFKPGYEQGYDWSCTKYFPGPTKYNADDGKKILEPMDDAASIRWGGSWRIPTADEWERLLDKKIFTWEAAKIGSVDGFTVTSKVKGFEGNQIFLPIACDIVGLNLAQDGLGCYWTSTAEDYYYEQARMYAMALRFGKDCPPGVRTGGRCDGFCIRPVKE